MDHYYTYASVDVPLKNLMEKEFNLPTLIENDATAACFGEHWLDLEKGYKNVIYLFSGVGLGLMLNGEVYRGCQGYAGEISVYNFKEQDAFNCETGGPCFIKRWEVDLGIVDDVKARLSKDKEGSAKFFKLTSSNIDNVDLKSVFIGAKAKDTIAQGALALAARRLGIKAAYLVNVLNPEVVVIGGGFEEAGEDFINKVSSTIREWAFREAVDNLKIVYSQLRENSVALGAASLVTQKMFAQLW